MSMHIMWYIYLRKSKKENRFSEISMITQFVCAECKEVIEVSGVQKL